MLLLFQVSDRDTLRSIAAMFDTTPSELKKLNKLMSDMVFPGKVRRFSFFDRTSDDGKPDIQIHADYSPVTID